MVDTSSPDIACKINLACNMYDTPSLDIVYNISLPVCMIHTV
jgi:hypothetical protein